MEVDELLAQVLRLPRHERARVAEELLSSIEEPDEEAAAAWVTELEKRSQEVAGGSARVISWEAAQAEMKMDLAQRRARRSPS
jgi:putative addiction module component (TIGR02574 family)